MEKRSGIKAFGAHSGFTLIELLVVVLIIGILAAVALPQYQLMADKTRLMRLLPLARAIKNAQEIFWLDNGRYATTWEELGFELPSSLVVGGSQAYSSYGSGANLRIILYGSEYFGIGTFKPDFLFVWTYDKFPTSSGQLACYAYNDYAEQVRKKICTKIGDKWVLIEGKH